MVPPGRVGGPRGTGEPPKEFGIEEKKGEASVGPPALETYPIIPIGPDPAHILPPEGFRILKILSDSIPIHPAAEEGASVVSTPPPTETVLELGLRKSLGIAEEGWFQVEAERPEGADPFHIRFFVEPVRWGGIYDATWQLVGLSPDRADPTGSHFLFDFQSHLGDLLPLRMTMGQATAANLPLRKGILDVEGRDRQFVLRRQGLPADEGFNPYVPKDSPVLGEPWLRALKHTDQAAVASFKGPTNKYEQNQDRLEVVVLDDGRIAMAVIDGVGWPSGGERSAEVIRQTVSSAWKDGYSLEQSINMSHEAAVRDNASQRGVGSATFAGLMERPDGSLEVRIIGDTEVLVVELPPGKGVVPGIVYWSTRPTPSQERLGIPLLPDGRIVLGHERVIRLDINSNVISGAVGGSYGFPVRQTADLVPLPPGKKYAALLMTDGLTEQFKSHQEIVDVIHQSGAETPQEMRDAVMREALVRCSLARMQREAREAARQWGKPFPMELTPERYAQAYREMTQELYGQPFDSPPGYRGMYEGYAITNDGYIVHPDVAATFNPESLSFNPLTADPRLVVGRFKEDNITLGVVHFQR